MRTFIIKPTALYVQALYKNNLMGTNRTGLVINYAKLTNLVGSK